MITPSYSVTATERVLPRMALDFTTGVLDSRVTVTRALNTATRVNSSGFIETINANLPRFDYDPVTLLPKGLLIEEARENICLNSQNITSTTFSNVGGTVTITGNTTDVTSPAGNNTASKVDASTAALNVQNIVSASGSAYTMSIYVRPATPGNQIRFGWFDTLDRRVDFTLSGAGSFSGLTNATSASITAVGNSWYRVTMTATTSTTTPQARFLYPTAASVNYFWGAQFELGAFATSYIPTTTTSLTRNADAVTMTSTNFSSWYNQTQGALGADFTLNPGLPSTGNRLLVMSGVNGNDRVIDINATTNWISYNGTANVSSGVAAVTSSTVAKAIAAHAAGSYALAIDGNTPGTASSALLNTATQLYIGSYPTGAAYLNGHIRSVRYWPQRLTNAEVQAFSKV